MGVKNNTIYYTKYLIYLIIIALVNIAGITLYFRIDLTSNKIYSISTASKKVVSTLEEPLTINVFFTKNLPTPHNNTELYIRDLLEEYSIHGNNNFNYRFYDVNPAEGGVDLKTNKNQELAKSYGIHPVQIQHIEQDEVKFKKAYMGLVLIHGDMIEKIPTITSIEGLEYKLTTSIQKLNNKISALLNLSENIKINLYLSSSLKKVAPYMRLNNLMTLPQQLEETIKKINLKNYGKIEFKHFDPANDTALEADIKKYNILTLKWPALSKGEINPGNGAAGIVMQYKEKSISIPIINVVRIPLFGTQYSMTNIDEMEEKLSENIELLVDINEDIGYLADHGTPVLSTNKMEMQNPDSLSNFHSIVSQNYTIKEIDLKGDVIPDSINCLIIARPTEQFTDFDLFQIDQFLMKGKSLAFFIDSFKKEQSPNNQQYRFNKGPSHTEINTGIEKLFSHYGINISKSYIMDENCYKQRVPRNIGGGERAIYFAPIIKDKFINHDFEFMKNIKGLVVMNISALSVDAKKIKENGLKAHKLFSSSEKSWETDKNINLNPLFIQPPGKEEMKTFPLTYIIKGEFPSFFAGKKIPEKQIKKDEKEKNKKPDFDISKIKQQGEILIKGKPGKIFLIGTSAVLKNNMLDNEGKSSNATFVMNVIDFLNNREDIAVMRSKEQRFSPLYETTADTKRFVKLFNIAGLPIIVILIGVFIGLKRRLRKKNIQMMFQKVVS